MIVCPICNHTNPEGTDTCESCGGSLENFLYRVCPSCDALNPAQNTFCHRCLSPLTASAQEAVSSAEDVEPSPPAPEDISEAQAPPAIDHAEIGEKTLIATADAGEADTSPEPLEEAESPEPLEEPLAPPEVAPDEADEEKEEEPEESPEPLPDLIAAPLAGIDDLLPLEMAVSLPHRAMLPESVEPTETEQRDAELFQRIAGEPAPLHEPARTILPRTSRILPKSGRTILYLLVLLAALTPLFTGDLFASWVRPRESVVAMAQLLDGLSDDAVVLISFDYTPAYAGEMDPLALAVVRHLAKKSVHIVAMSTKPGGVGLAEQVYHTISNELPSLIDYGENYAVLGYLPGQESGLRTLAKSLTDAFKTDHVQRRSLTDLPITSKLASASSFDHIIVLSDDTQAVRHWIEQVQSRSDIKLHALVTSRVEPMLIPYRESGQLATLFAGSYGSIEYPLASGARFATTRVTGAYAALFLVFLLTAIVTNVMYISKAKSKPQSG